MSLGGGGRGGATAPAQSQFPVLLMVNAAWFQEMCLSAKTKVFVWTC